LSQPELRDLCLRLSKFKKENKELLSYLLFDSSNEINYIENIKNEVIEEFTQINRKSNYYINKSSRKILRTLKKYIRYSTKKETEVELLIFFCSELNSNGLISQNNIPLLNLYKRHIETIRKKISDLHEDLQYDYERELNEL
ncbi:MAG: hypothetical protein JEZ03_14740, partial [Bacteroidales bacterium]|nr:hypothetical protein [Bacteroidales bacterium]